MVPGNPHTLCARATMARPPSRATDRRVAQHVVIAGGGLGALEGVLPLQSLLTDPPAISILTAQRHVTIGPCP